MDQKIAHSKFSALNPDQQEILRLRFEDGEGVRHTYREVAEILRTHRNVVRDRERKALRKLGHPRDLRPFLAMPVQSG